MILELLEYHLCVRGSCHRGSAQIDQQKSLMEKPTNSSKALSCYEQP